MDRTKTVRLVCDIIYAIGATIVLVLSIVGLFGPNKAVFPEAMLPFTYKELASIWLAIGAVPMLVACMAVYKVHDRKNSAHKKRAFILTFLPGFVCGVCGLLAVGVIIAGFVKSILLR